MKHKILFCTVVFFNLLGAHSQQMQDCQDHSLISRYPGAVIVYCDTQNHKPFALATGPETGYREISEWVQLEGKATRIYYSIAGNHTVSEVYQNYVTAIENSEFRFLAKKLHPDRNVSGDVGGNSWLTTFYAANPFPSNVGIRINQGSGSLGGTFHIAAGLNGVYVVISGKRYSDNETVVLLDIIETSEVDDGLIAVNADYLANQLKKEGHVSLPGILFDFNQAVIKPESEPLLNEIAIFMQADTATRLYVVGHTDMTGELDYNLELSVLRASAVVNYLTEKKGIALTRIAPQGLGPLAPVATNETEEGRRKNRRVELVSTTHRFLPR